MAGSLIIIAGFLLREIPFQQGEQHFSLIVRVELAARIVMRLLGWSLIFLDVRGFLIRIFVTLPSETKSTKT
jgi:hypothetical protein